MKSLISYDIPTMIVCSDASKTGLAYMYKNSKLNILFKTFSSSESMMHSTWRELHVIHLSVESLSFIFKGQAVFWKSDNYAGSRERKK